MAAIETAAMEMAAPRKWEWDMTNSSLITIVSYLGAVAFLYDFGVKSPIVWGLLGVVAASAALTFSIGTRRFAKARGGDFQYLCSDWLFTAAIALRIAYGSYLQFHTSDIFLNPIVMQLIYIATMWRYWNHMIDIGLFRGFWT